MTGRAPGGRAVGLASPLLRRRLDDVHRLLAEEGGVRPLSLLRRPPAGLRQIACFLDDRQGFRERVYRYARRWGLPVLALRRGPFGALLLPPAGGRLPLLSLMVGPGQAGDLQAAVQRADGASAAEARHLIQHLRRLRLGLANHTPLPAGGSGTGGRPLVFVLDEPAPVAVQQAMLAAARAENPGAEVRILPLPGLDGEGRAGTLSFLAAGLGITVAAGDLSSAHALAGAARLYVYGHMLGLEALIQGVPVTCFGFPPYAGWGLTDDRGDGPAQGKIELPVLVAALLTFCRFNSPYDQGRADLDLLLRHGAAVLARDSRTAGETVMVEGDPALRTRLRPFLDSRTGRSRFAASDQGARPLLDRQSGTRLARWTHDPPFGFPVPATLWLEDQIFAPLDLPPGLFFPGDTPAETAICSPADGDRLLAHIRARFPAPIARGQPRLLIPDEPGLGPDDYRAVVQAARAAHSGARIITTARLPDIGADEMTTRPPHLLLDEIDGLHTVASALGFAALLRAVPVTTHGTPFYAGRGLTTDHCRPAHPSPRAPLSLAGLAAHVLIGQTAYVDPACGLPCDLWTAIDRMGRHRDRPTSWIRRLTKRWRT